MTAALPIRNENTVGADKRSPAIVNTFSSIAAAEVSHRCRRLPLNRLISSLPPKTACCADFKLGNEPSLANPDGCEVVVCINIQRINHHVRCMLLQKPINFAWNLGKNVQNSNFVPRTKNDEFFWHEPKGECLKNHRFECEVRILLFAAESKKQGQKGPFLTSPDASKNTVFETPWQKRIEGKISAGNTPINNEPPSYICGCFRFLLLCTVNKL